MLIPRAGLRVPYCQDMKDMGSEAMQKKFVEGPNALVTIRANLACPTWARIWAAVVLTLAVAAAVAVITAGSGPQVQPTPPTPDALPVR